MEYEKEFALEQQYLKKTCDFVRENLTREEEACADEKDQVIAARREMWETVSFRGGFDNAVEAHQALESIQAQSARYDAAHKRIDHLRQALETPYFARVDFTENGYESDPAEKIYIGLSTVQDEDSYETFVYDWRTPIASLFYRYETGPVEYLAPSGTISYQDAMPMLYLHLRLFGCDQFPDIRQVVVDEAQDYYPVHFHILRQLFPNARYTVMGDYNQTIEKQEGPDFYQEVDRILHKKNSCLITLNKGFRCSYEINEFSRRFLSQSTELESFERHEQPPLVEQTADLEQMAERIAQLTADYLGEGYASVGIICKTHQQANRLYEQLRSRISVHLMDTDQPETFSGVMLMPVYMAKGLEFDAAILCGVDDQNYRTGFDRQLLYVSCTRALHRLAILHTGKPSRFLQLN